MSLAPARSPVANCQSAPRLTLPDPANVPIGYPWPASQLTSADMQMLCELKNRTGRPLTKLLKQAVSAYYQPERGRDGCGHKVALGACESDCHNSMKRTARYWPMPGTMSHWSSRTTAVKGNLRFFAWLPSKPKPQRGATSKNCNRTLADPCAPTASRKPMSISSWPKTHNVGDACRPRSSCLTRTCSYYWSSRQAAPRDFTNN